MHVTPYDCLHKILSYYNMAKTLKNRKNCKGGAKKTASAPDPKPQGMAVTFKKKSKAPNTLGKARTKGPVQVKASKTLKSLHVGNPPDTGSFKFTMPSLNDELSGNVTTMQRKIIYNVNTFLASYPDTGIAPPILALASQVSSHIMGHFLSMGIATEQDVPSRKKGAALDRGVGVSPYRKNKIQFDQKPIVQEVYKKLTGKNFYPIHICAVEKDEKGSAAQDLAAFNRPIGELAHQDPATLVQGELNTGGEMKNVLFHAAVTHPILKIAAEIQKKDAGSFMARKYNEGNDHVWTRDELPIRKLNAVRLIAQATVLRDTICRDPVCLQLLQGELGGGGGGGETMLEKISKDCLKSAVNSISFLQGFSARISHLNPRGAHTGTLFSKAKGNPAQGAAAAVNFQDPSNFIEHQQKRQEFMQFLRGDDAESEDESYEDETDEDNVDEADKLDADMVNIQNVLNEPENVVKAVLKDTERRLNKAETRLEALFKKSPTFRRPVVWKAAENFEENYKSNLRMIHTELNQYFKDAEDENVEFTMTKKNARALRRESKKIAKQSVGKRVAVQSLLHVGEGLLPLSDPRRVVQTQILRLKKRYQDFVDRPEPNTKALVLDSLVMLHKMKVYVYGIPNLRGIFNHLRNANEMKQLYAKEIQEKQGKKPSGALIQSIDPTLTIYSYHTKLPLDDTSADEKPAHAPFAVANLKQTEEIHPTQSKKFIPFPSNMERMIFKERIKITEKKKRKRLRNTYREIMKKHAQELKKYYATPVGNRPPNSPSLPNINSKSNSNNSKGSS